MPYQLFQKILISNKISNLRHQITNKTQFSIFNDQNLHHNCIESIRKLIFADYDAVGQYRKRIICLEF